MEELGGKTKAKKRYLKVKKERRKRRKLTHHGSLSREQEKNSESGQESNPANQLTADRNVSDILPIVQTDLNLSPEPERCSELTQVSPELAEQIPRLLPHIYTPAVALPSRAVHSLRGDSSSLTDAVIIDPQKTVPVECICTLEDSTKSCKSDACSCTFRISTNTKLRLLEIGITSFFAVQTAVLPFILTSEDKCKHLYLPYKPPRDVCVSAPTGSGKTIAYVLPIVEILMVRKVVRLRAVVILPTRALVIQVRDTFEALSKGSGLKIGIATGQHSFNNEQRSLIDDFDSVYEGGSSRVDILICTPGRLLDHLEFTANFTLQHLRFLVIDEADRLLSGSFQGWLEPIVRAVELRGKSQENGKADLQMTPRPCSPLCADSLAPARLPDIDSDLTIGGTARAMNSCQKLLISATLTPDPGILKRLHLRNPQYYIVQKPTAEDAQSMPGHVEMPEELEQRFVVTSTTLKPLVLFYLIYKYCNGKALIFTKSTKATTQLQKLLSRIFDVTKEFGVASCGISMCSYSSDLSPRKRSSILRRFRRGEISHLICSDLVSRGIDISLVDHVISYDVPVELAKYVHRVGRTARAGNHGTAWTLVEPQEVWHFKQMLRSGGLLQSVDKFKVAEAELSSLMPAYETLLHEKTP